MLHKIKITLFVFLFALLWAPMIQQQFKIFDEVELKGAFIKPNMPVFTLDSLNNLGFQKKFEDYQNFNFGFRPFFVKLKNTVNYLTFDELSVSDNIVGKQKFIFSVGSTRRTLGFDYNGLDKNNATLDKINILKRGVEKHGGKFLVLIAPSKESVIPDYLPRPFNEGFNSQTDYKDFIEGLKRRQIAFIDYCKIFNQLKKSGKPLFTKTGFHWSLYGASIAQDSLIDYIQRTSDKPMPQYEHDGIEFSSTPRMSDADFEEPLNLLFDIGQTQYIYPKLKIKESTKSNFRPKAIFIGDSYFWQIKGQKILQEVLSKDSKYWYYFSSNSFPIGDEPGVPMENLNIIQELENSNYVILITNIGNLGTFPFGVDDYYITNNSDWLMAEIENGLKAISSFDELKKEAEANTIDLNSLIKGEINKIYKNKSIILIKAINNKFVCSDQNLNNCIIANRDVCGRWETFTLLQLDDKHVIIYSYETKFLSIESNKFGDLNATKTKIGNWEVFELEKLKDGFVAFKATNGKYLSLDEKSNLVYANKATIGKTEMFKIEKVTEK